MATPTRRSQAAAEPGFRSDQAACHGQPHEMFFPHGREQERRATPLALAVCHTCPVRAACLSHALTAPERFGIWGGTTASQRGWDKHGKRHRHPRLRLPT